MIDETLRELSLEELLKVLALGEKRLAKLHVNNARPAVIDDYEKQVEKIRHAITVKRRRQPSY